MARLSSNSSIVLLMLMLLKDANGDQCTNTTREFKWETIEPSADLNWVDCFSGYSCARLQVPLDYSQPNGEQAIIALTRQVSPNGPDAPDYAGPILINPGGPGSSGTDFIHRAAPSLRVLLGPTFNLVSFDPRGVAASAPRANFFTTEVERKLWEGSRKETLLKEQRPLNWAQRQMLTPLIEGKNTAGSGYLKSLTTENTARDMLYIIGKYGWKQLKYLGYSYGTVLGMTFASLFPDRIERMIIDGVVDADDYYATTWQNNLLDTDSTMQAFFDGCYSAGISGCPFWQSSPSLIKNELDALYDHVIEAPVPVPISSNRYGVVDYEVLRSAVFSSLYSPYALFPFLARALAALRSGDGSTIIQFSEASQEKVSCSCDSNQYTFTSVRDAQYAIACNDGATVDASLDGFLEYSDELRNKSSWADSWERIRLFCSAYPHWEKSHFQGPVGATNTSFPLLLIGNTADPVTPLEGAKKMAKRFGGAVVLTQNSPGHESTAAPSTCTANVIREYMVNGILPADGTVCEVDRPIWTPANNQSSSTRSIATLPEQMLLESLEDLARAHVRTTLFNF
ncbi:TAP-like protein-domain-containing protein [Flagelloscypha sp. PMI_526]|nr:TAP-like protein-domain-containing protein [Flagelloscypha sp. PMI_526]